MLVFTAEELVSSGYSSFYLVQLPYNLHLCSENEPNLPEFGKPKSFLVLRGWVWVYRWEWMPPSPLFPLAGTHLWLSFPSWWFGGKPPGPWLSRQEKGRWACHSPVGNVLSHTKPSSLLLSNYQIIEFFHFYSVNFDLHDAIWIKALKETLTNLPVILPFLFAYFILVFSNSQAA